MPILNYTTQIDVTKTIGEIETLLAKHGATDILKNYEGGICKIISFQIPTDEGLMPIRMPMDEKPILQLLKIQPRVPRKLQTEEQAIRVGWRIVKNWLEAQLAIIETRMVKIEQVMLPYIVGKDGKTLYETIKGLGFNLTQIEDRTDEKFVQR